MDAKSKANFINSVAAGQVVPCPRCGTANKPGSKTCVSCGADIVVAETSAAPAFAAVAETEQMQTASKYVEPTSVFADGLPDWDIVPPQVMVRRH
ncbi:MAG: zinc ribbon domain-containing protein [Firmicutes bacterium]|nr:zinc ribbon domain-containing protein [Bacillota bacterium]